MLTNVIEGIDNPKGGVFFRKQRRRADQSSRKTAAYFFELMKKIGQELQDNNQAFTVQADPGKPPNILDICMAPGGFLAAALKFNPDARALAFSLPHEKGGHRVLMPNNVKVEKKCLDITMLAEDMGCEKIPKDHPDANNFLPQQLETGQLFDLIICDGQVLRTHLRASYREDCEARRLTTAQLALGLEHVEPGGTMIILLHKVEAWDTMAILNRFHRISNIKLFKPKLGHATRSSFYLIATNIQSQHPEALAAIKQWKAVWRTITFDSEECHTRVIRDGDPSPEQLLREFGPDLVEFG
ncbi:hypothetical protein ACKAV7_009797 [Fusarium commune]